MIVLLVSATTRCGSTPSVGPSTEAGSPDTADASFVLGDASDRGDALGAQIERNHVAATFITLSCAEGCAQVEAVATGGNPPYTYAWDDGITSASRHVCPTVSASYYLTVSDTGTSGEFARAPETAQASLTAEVIACPDGGAILDAASDEGGSGDGSSGTSPGGPADGGGCIDPGAAPWSGCMTVSVGQEAMPSAFGGWCTQPQTNGNPYSWLVCLPHSLLAGHEYGVKVTYQIQNLQGPVPQSGVSGSPGGCTAAETLLPLQGWPIASPYNGTFSQFACVTADGRYPQLFYQEVQESLSGYVGTTTFEVCNGCSSAP
jgi:hypothetical protein